MISQLYGRVTLPQGKELALPVAKGRGEPKSQSGPSGGAQKNFSLLLKIESRFSVCPGCILGVILRNDLCRVVIVTVQSRAALV